MMYDKELIDLETALDDLIDNQVKPDNSDRLNEIADIVSKNLGKHPDSRSRDAETMNSKRAFLWLSSKSGIKLEEAAKHIGLDRTTAIHHRDVMVSLIGYIDLVKKLGEEI